MDSQMTNTEIMIFQLEDFLKGYEEQEASVWIDLAHEGKKAHSFQNVLWMPCLISFGSEDHLCQRLIPPALPNCP